MGERALLLLAGGAAAAVVLLSLLMGASEAEPFLDRTSSLANRTESFRGSAEPRVALLSSPYARTARLDLCLTTLREVSSGLSSSHEVTASVARGCLAVARSFAASQPLSGNAWYIAATLAYRAGDMASVERFLERSYATAPNEQWIAERRGVFAYGLHDRLDPSLQAKIDDDFRLVLRTYTGVQVMAAAYAANTNLREHLTEVATTLDQQSQQRFAEFVRHQLQQQGEESDDQ